VVGQLDPIVVHTSGIMAWAWLIPSLPLIAFFVIVFFGKRTPGKGAPIGILATAASFVISVLVLVQVAKGHGTVDRSLFFFAIKGFHLEFGEHVDGLAAMMFCVVTLVSLCVQVYSTAYMHDDIRYTWFFAALSLFTGSMLNLVIADNLFQLLVGWELVGICSYLLIGHWWEEKENSNAAIKAFITTKTGDIPFMFGIFVLTFAAHGNANIPHITRLVSSGTIGAGTAMVAAFLLFGGAIGKSAQFPLQVWLPDAMAGPTPVSALIHAATMVVAGVYLVARMFAVFAANGHALAFVGTIGSITMLMAALLALVQDDIKRVLAYSTISQLAYMVSALGLGRDGYTAGLFHLFTHAFFKALLFLGAGSIIHSVHSNNMSEMGGLRKLMPITYATFGIGTLALMGIPPFAGFWSKDEIIATAWHTHHYPIFLVAVLTAFITALYMTRTIRLTFFGEYRGAAYPHESPKAMVYPMILLAVLSVGAGFLNTPFVHSFREWIGPAVGVVAAEPYSLALAAVSVAAGLLGIALGWSLYRTYQARDPMLQLGPASTVLVNKYYMDDLYLKGIVRPVQYGLSAAVYWVNQNVLDGAVNGAAWLTRRLSVGVNEVDKNVVDGAVNGVGQGARWAGRGLRLLQTGRVQQYAILMFAVVAVAVVVFTAVH
jgi:NADH-quinone oxidoreductase subunit L